MPKGMIFDLFIVVLGVPLSYTTAAAVVFAMCSISVMTFGAIWALGLKLNAISSILLVSVIGKDTLPSLTSLSVLQVIPTSFSYKVSKCLI